MSREDSISVRRANKETCMFFSLICQFLIAYILYSIARLTILAINDEKSPWTERIPDIADIVLTFSYLIMLYGVADSTKKSIDRNIRD
jgi:hypothetical protein